MTIINYQHGRNERTRLSECPFCGKAFKKHDSKTKIKHLQTCEAGQDAREVRFD